MKQQHDPAAHAVHRSLFLPHLRSIEENLNSAKAKVELAKSVREQILSLFEGIKQKRAALKDEFAETERKLQQSFQDKGLVSIEPDEYADLTKKKEETISKIAQLEGGATQHKVKLDAVYVALAKFNEACLEEFRSARDTLKAINESQVNLTVDVEFKGSKDDFLKKLEELCKGKGVRKEYLQEMSKNYSDFGRIFKSLDAASKTLKSKSEVFSELFLDHLPELLEFRVPDSYSVKYHGKDLRAHSLGQRASAMMMFLLSQGDCETLLIDQPEDDLDSQTIYAEVIKTLRQNKSSQQFIFATHNANFPVLGDAEMVVSCEFGEEIVDVRAGSIDDEECQERIVEVMEGGAEAFNRRKIVYESWLG
nr:hypothetical protein [uncultured Shimia sp.]